MTISSACATTTSTATADPGDEVPYVAMGNWGGDLYTFIMNSFIFYDGRATEKLDITEDGNIYSVLDQDAFREGLKFHEQAL